MEFITDLLNPVVDFFNGINFETFFQLLMLALVLIAGPAVIVVLAFRGGDL